MAGSLDITGRSDAAQGASQIGPITITGSQTIDEILQVPLQAGDTTIAVPEGAVAAVIALPVGNTVPVKIRTNLNPGDTGLPIAATGALTLTLAAGTTSLILNATSNTGPLTFSFI